MWCTYPMVICILHSPPTAFTSTVEPPSNTTTQCLFRTIARLFAAMSNVKRRIMFGRTPEHVFLVLRNPPHGGSMMVSAHGQPLERSHLRHPSRVSTVKLQNGIASLVVRTKAIVFAATCGGPAAVIVIRNQNAWVHSQHLKQEERDSHTPTPTPQLHHTL